MAKSDMSLGPADHHVVPSLLHGCGTWVGITAAIEKKLNDLQLWFARLALQVGKGTPRAALTWETGLLDMQLRIWIEKVMLVLHIQALEESSLARQMYEEQKANNWPGLAKETKTICENLGVEDVNSTAKGKKEYKKIMVEACLKKDEAIKRKQAEGNIKCDKIMKDSYGKKSYVRQQNINVSREYFRTRVSMHRFAGNYRHDPAFRRTGGLCRCGTAPEQEQHLTSGDCPLYKDIWEQHSDITDDQSLVIMFREILARRDAIDSAVVAGTDATGGRQPGGNPGQADLGT